MSNRVIRLGGSNIGDTNSIQNLFKYLDRDGGKKLVVVSAIPELLNLIKSNIDSIFFKEINESDFVSQLNKIYTEQTNSEPSEGYRNLTEKLVNILKGIALIGDYSKALKDHIISYSEKLSVEILKNRWQNVQVVLPEEFDLKTSSDFGNATFISLNPNFFDHLSDGIYIIPGSYGINEDNKIVRTGITSADYTAAFLTASLKIEKLELWDLDKKFQKADPDIVADPPKISRLTYAEASELAYFQHYSFHPRTVEPLEGLHIPIYILDSSTDTGTIETKINTETFIDEKIVKSVACTDDISLLKLDGPGVGLKPGILAKVTSCLNESEINIKSVITSQISINLILEKATGEKALRQIEQLGFNSVQKTTLVKDVSLIGVIGHGMQQNYGVSAKIFNAVAQNKINVLLSGSGASDLVSYLIVKSSDKEKSVREIYNAFFN